MKRILMYNIVKAVLQSYVEDYPERYELREDALKELKEPCLGVNGLMGGMESGGFLVEVEKDTGDLVIHVSGPEIVARGEMKQALLLALKGASAFAVEQGEDEEIELSFTYEGVLTVHE